MARRRSIFLKDAIDTLGKLRNCLNSLSSEEFITEGLDYMIELMKERIHTQGLDANDALISSSNPNPTSIYSDTQRRRRRLAGRQLTLMDLKFSGNLSESMISGVREKNKKFVIGFKSFKIATVARYIESQRGTSIFFPTDEEIDKLRVWYIERIPEIISECLD